MNKLGPGERRHVLSEYRATQVCVYSKATTNILPMYLLGSLPFIGKKDINGYFEEADVAVMEQGSDVFHLATNSDFHCLLPFL